MYKVIPFFLIFLAFTYYSDVYAETVSSPVPHDYKSGLLDDDFIIIENQLEKQFYDNSLVTNHTLDSNKLIVFKYPVDLTGYYTSVVNPHNNRFNLRFENGTIQEINNIVGKNGYFSLDYTDVKSIELVKSSTSFTFQEIDFFGTYTIPGLDPVTNLKETHNYNSVSLTWDNPTDVTDLKNIIIRNNGVEVAKIASNSQSYTITNLNPETDYVIEVIAEYSDGGLSTSAKIDVTTSVQPDDINPPGEISNLAFGVSSSGVTFSWINPPDTDFSHVRIYRDNQLIEDRHTQNEYQNSGLKPNTTYVFKFVTVDNDGNNSMGYIQTVKTDAEVDNFAPATPTGLNVTNGSSSGSLRWNKNSEPDLLGYNVYVDGAKHNSSVIMSTTYVVSNLTNDQTYDISISAVDTSFNESVLSNTVALTPFAGGMPVFETSYDLQLVADGTGSWFNAFWPILAFAVGIPLAFYVSNRVKGLFFA